MRVAVITTDNREHHGTYDVTTPLFGTAPHALFEGFALFPDIELHVVSCSRRAMSHKNQLAKNTFFHSVLVPSWGWLRTAYMPCLLNVRKKLKEIRPDIVHGQGTERDCALGAAFSGFPNVVTIHGNMRAIAQLHHAKPFSYMWIAARLESLTLPRTCGVFCNSAYTEGLVGKIAKRTWRVPNALQQAFFEGAFQNGHSKNPQARLVNIGAVSERKRTLEILELATKLHQSGFKFELVFAGGVNDSPYGKEFKERIVAAEKAGYARYVGFKTGPDLISLLDSSHALVHFPTEEAFGLVVGEAIARGLKLFGTRTGGIIEIAEGVADASLFEPNDWDGIKTSIANWITSGFPTSRTGSDLMRQRYHPVCVARTHLDIYREVLK